MPNYMGIEKAVDTAFKTANYLQSSQANFQNMLYKKEQMQMLKQKQQREEDMNIYTNTMEYVTNRDNILNHYREGTQNQLYESLDKANGIAKKYGLPSTYSMKSIVYNAWMKDVNDARTKWATAYSQGNDALGDSVQKELNDRWGGGQFAFLEKDLLDKYNIQNAQTMQLMGQQRNSMLDQNKAYNNEINAVNNKQFEDDETATMIKEKMNAKQQKRELFENGGSDPRKQELDTKYKAGTLTKEEKSEYANKYGAIFGGEVNGFDLDGVESGKALDTYNDFRRKQEIDNINKKYASQLGVDTGQVPEYWNRKINDLNNQMADMSSQPTLSTGIQVLMKNEKDMWQNQYINNWKMNNNVADIVSNKLPYEFWIGDKETKQKIFSEVVPQLTMPEKIKQEVMANPQDFVNLNFMPANAYKTIEMHNQFIADGYKLDEIQTGMIFDSLEKFKGLLNMPVNYFTTDEDINNWSTLANNIFAETYHGRGISPMVASAYSDSIVKMLKEQRNIALTQHQQEELQAQINNQLLGLKLAGAEADIQKTYSDINLNNAKAQAEATKGYKWGVEAENERIYGNGGKPYNGNGGNGGSNGNGDTQNASGVIYSKGKYYVKQQKNGTQQLWQSTAQGEQEITKDLKNIPKDISYQSLINLIDKYGVDKVKNADAPTLKRMIYMYSHGGRYNIQKGENAYWDESDWKYAKNYLAEYIGYVNGLSTKGDAKSKKKATDYGLKHFTKENVLKAISYSKGNDFSKISQDEQDILMYKWFGNSSANKQTGKADKKANLN